MNKQFLRFVFFLLTYLTLPLTVTAQVVDIPDSNLRAAVEKALGKASGAIITAADMANLTHLEAKNTNINDLTGLQHATDLTRLDLGAEWVEAERELLNSNSVSNLSPLAGLTNLSQLRLRDNNITDISPLASLISFTRLGLRGNNISNLSPLAGLTNLTWLDLWDNNITDISALVDLTSLTELRLGGNNLSNISALAGLINLETLLLRGNNISDISTLSGLTNLTRLGLAHNNLSNISALEGLTNLKTLGLAHNNISDIAPLAELTSLAKVGLRYNDISDIFSLVANTGLGSGDQIMLNDNPLSYKAMNTHIPALQSRGVIVEFDDKTHLKVGEERMARIIYFVPNDQSYRPAIVQQMKNKVHIAQTFFAEQMEAHGYGRLTFDVETDAQGKSIVHRVDGQRNTGYYHASRYHSRVLDEIKENFNVFENVYLIVIEYSGDTTHGGVGHKFRKNGGALLVPDTFDWIGITHEFGHAFGLFHDFRDSAYLLSYGPGQPHQLSACHAAYLSVHPYFNPHIPTERNPSPIIEVLSPRTYPVGSQSIPIQFRISDSDGLRLWLLHAWQPHVRGSVKTYREEGGTQDITINFDYDGVIPSAHDPVYSKSTSLLNPTAHPILIEAVDINGNVGNLEFLILSEAFQPLSKVSGDNQHGVPNTPLPVPFVVELRDPNNGWGDPGVPVTFTVTAGGGTLNPTHTTTADTAAPAYKMGKAQSILTLGPNLGINTVEVSAAGIEGTVTFTAVAGAAIVIPDPNLRAAVENDLGKRSGTPIAPADMANLTHLEAKNANISDLTGLEHATNLQSLELGYGKTGNSNAVTDLSPLADLIQLTSLDLAGNSISDISAVTGLTNLTWLHFWGNSISDISAVAGLTKLTDLYLGDNNISDISPLVANTGLGSGDTVYVQYNPLSYQSIHTHVPVLQSRGVTVEFENRAHPALLKIAGDNQHGMSLVPLSQPFAVEAQDASGSALAGISVTFAVTEGGGTLNTTITRTDANGRAQSTLTLGPNLGTNTVQVSATGIQGLIIFNAVSDTESPLITADVNNDGNVNVLDLVVIASELGNTVTNLAVDVNGDGAVNVLDLILVAGMFEGAAAAPSAYSQVPETLTAVEVQGWLIDARTLEVRNPIMKRGFAVLEQLLISLAPKETELLANYPNPFNPETWIPYRLAEDAFVTLTIYDGAGQIVRTIDLGHQTAAAYESRSNAIYWDGRNQVGESVASGVYFYHLSAGRSGLSVPHRSNFSATRKMLILK